MKSRRFDPLLDLARSREDAARRDLADKTRALDSQQQRLSELERYAEDYGAAADSVLDQATLLNRLAFRERIDEALARQARVVSQVRENCDLERTRLLLAGRDTKVLERLAASYRHEEQRRDRKREQGQVDDGVANGRARRQTASGEDA